MRPDLIMKEGRKERASDIVQFYYFYSKLNMWTPAFQFQLQTRNILANFPMIIRCNRVAIQDNNKSKYEIVPILGSKQ